jgi:hypothetical protein
MSSPTRDVRVAAGSILMLLKSSDHAATEDARRNFLFPNCVLNFVS